MDDIVIERTTNNVMKLDDDEQALFDEIQVEPIRIKRAKAPKIQKQTSRQQAEPDIDLDAFTNKGIGIEVMDYGHYKPYEQPHGEFMHNVSALDLLANVGLGSRNCLVGRTEQI